MKLMISSPAFHRHLHADIWRDVISWGGTDAVAHFI